MYIDVELDGADPEAQARYRGALLRARRLSRRMDDATRADMARLTGCVAGALTREEFERSPRARACGRGNVHVRKPG